MKKDKPKVFALLLFLGVCLSSFQYTCAQDDPFAEPNPNQPIPKSKVVDPFNESKPAITPVIEIKLDLDSISVVKKIGKFGNSREDKIHDTLDRKVDADVFACPFGDVISHWQANCGLQIVLDDSARNNQLDEEAEITTKLSNISLKSMIRIILNPYECTYVIKDEVMYIMSNEHAEQHRYCMFYDCSELVASLDGIPEDNFKKLIESIQASIDPGSWNSKTRNNGVSEVGGFLVVSTNSVTHDRVEGFLQSLQKLNAKKHAASGSSK